MQLLLARADGLEAPLLVRTRLEVPMAVNSRPRAHAYRQSEERARGVSERSGRAGERMHVASGERTDTDMDTDMDTAVVLRLYMRALAVLANTDRSREQYEKADRGPVFPMPPCDR